MAEPSEAPPTANAISNQPSDPPKMLEDLLLTIYSIPEVLYCAAKKSIVLETVGTDGAENPKHNPWFEGFISAAGDYAKEFPAKTVFLLRVYENPTMKQNDSFISLFSHRAAAEDQIMHLPQEKANEIIVYQIIGRDLIERGGKAVFVKDLKSSPEWKETHSKTGEVLVWNNVPADSIDWRSKCPQIREKELELKKREEELEKKESILKARRENVERREATLREDQKLLRDGKAQLREKKKSKGNVAEDAADPEPDEQHRRPRHRKRGDAPPTYSKKGKEKTYSTQPDPESEAEAEAEAEESEEPTQQPVKGSRRMKSTASTPKTGRTLRSSKTEKTAADEDEDAEGGELDADDNAEEERNQKSERVTRSASKKSKK